MNRVSTVVLALACLVAGFAVAGPRVKALDDVSPARFPSGITVGTRVVMSFGSESVPCTIERIDAGWVKCAPDEVDPFQKVEREWWYAIAHVTDVRIAQPKR